MEFVCQGCAYSSPKWLGKCPQCSEWNSFEEELYASKATRKNLNVSGKKVPLSLPKISVLNYQKSSTGIEEFDRVMGGGIVPGSLTLVGGEPGIGKSTLVGEVLGKLSENNKVIYISGEESVAQVADRIKRLGIAGENFLIYNETSWEQVRSQLKKIKPSFVVLDSIQTMMSPDIQSAPGTVSQIREVTHELMNFVKANNITCFVIGHITKEGNIAGPKVLEHMVDTVIYFEGDQIGQYRILRAIKNRFGNTNEVGIFEMRGNGLEGVKNPSQCFLDDHIKDSFGRSLTCVTEGSRSLFVEIQALVVENKFGNGRRTTQGLESNRLAMLVAIIEKYFDLPIGFNDIYVNVVGGIKLDSRESDLSVIASLLSSFYNRPIDPSIIFLGEVGLTGEVRSIPQMETRLKEMDQLNYRKAITSKKIAKEYFEKFGVELIGIKRASELKDLLFT